MSKTKGKLPLSPSELKELIRFEERIRLIKEINDLNRKIHKQEKRIKRIKAECKKSLQSRRPGIKVVNCSCYPNSKIQEILKFVTPKDAQKLRAIVTVLNNKPGNCFSGSAQIISQKLRLGIASKNRLKKILPYRRPKDIFQFGYQPMRLNNTDEILVHLFAHEIRHLWQAYLSKANWIFKLKTHYYNGKRTHYSKQQEKDADLYSLRKLKQWRRSHRD